MADRRKFPVQHRDNARLRRMKNQVAEPEIAMDDRARVGDGVVRRQPFDQLVHRRDRSDIRRDILTCPAADLTVDVILRPPVTFETGAPPVHAMQRGHHAVHVVIHRRAVRVRKPRQRAVSEHASRYVIHQVESRSDHVGIHAEQPHSRHRNAGVRERRLHAVFPVDRVGRRQQLAGWLLAQHVVAARRREVERRIRLAALELPHPRRPGEARHFGREIVLQTRLVETVIGERRHQHRRA